MNTSISKRRAYLAAIKKSRQRITIGFAGIADFRSYIGQEYIAGIMKAAADYDINFINMAGAIKYSLFDDIDFISHYIKSFRFMKSPLIDGLITWASSFNSFLDSQAIVNTFSKLKPLPMVDIGYLDIPGVPSIRIDSNISIKLIIEHLIKEHNYKRFAFFGSEQSQPHKTRLNAYHVELKKNNIPELEDSIYMAQSMDSVDIAKCVEKLCSKYELKNKKSIDAIITSSDIIAEIVIEELNKRGISTPNDIAVTGYNNQYNSITSMSPVTTVNLEYFKRGYAAVELLIDTMISEKPIVETKYVTPSLILRQSCGCFEKSIIEAGCHNTNFNDFDITLYNSEDDLRQYLLSKLIKLFPQQTEAEVNDLVNSIFIDMYNGQSTGNILRWFQRFLQNQRQYNTFNNSQLQQSITDLRSLIIPLVKDNQEQLFIMEDIFQQLRTMISVFVEYQSLAQQNSTYNLTNLSQIAISFASATNGKEIQDVLKYQLNKFEIPGIILVLGDSMTSDISTSSVQLIWPEPPEDIKSNLPFKVYDPACVPKRFFPNNRRFSMMLEILYHKDKYFGYSFLEMGSQNISFYDTVRLLLSNALYSVYKKEGRTKDLSMTINGEQLIGILQLPCDNTNNDRNNVTINQITNYLIEHINEMTNLDKMSSELMISKSHLVRRCKELTGYTVQTLHEKLKIEQAKNLLQVDNIKLSEIALLLGFQNQNYFSNVFKKNTGLSPREWSKRKH